MTSEERAQPLVLVVDDDATMRLVATRTLRNAGLRTVEAGTAEIALDLFRREPADMVLMDVMLPGMDGFAAVRELRTTTAGRHVPVLMLTGLDDLESINAAYEAGATDFIGKPINWGVLGHRVRYILRAAEAFAALAENQALLASAQRVARLGSWAWNLESEAVRWSEETFQILGCDPRQVPSIAHMLEAIHPEDRPELETALAALRCDGLERDLILRLSPRLGESRFVRVRADAASDVAAGQVFGAIQDVSEIKSAEARIHQLSHFDRLTQLPNRQHFAEATRIALDRARASSELTAVLSLDLDQFMRINDTLGHAAGDRLLVAVAERLKKATATAASDGIHGGLAVTCVARLGGDEFSLLAEGVRHFDEVARLGRDVLSSLREPFLVDGHELFAPASLGVALFPADGHEAGELFRNADAALHVAKSEGRNDLRFYNSGMNDRAAARLSLESRLRKAVERGEFHLRYQPKLHLASGRIVGVEALIRWSDPSGRIVAPVEFIPLAEELGLIIPIGDWVLEQATRQAAQWRDAGIPLHVAVNIASPHFQQPGFVGRVERAMAASALQPRFLELEMTESMLMQERGDPLETLHALRDLGLRISVDDFGTGYSSLAYLKKFPVHSLKVDRSFITGTPDDEADCAIVSAIIALAHGLGLEVVAEGVETPDQMAYLWDEKCEYAQGYLVGTPMDASRIPQAVTDGATSPDTDE